MNSFRVDVQTPTGRLQHIVKAPTKAAATKRVTDRVYPKQEIIILNVQMRDVQPAKASQLESAREIRDALSLIPGSSAHRIAESVGRSREVVLKFLHAMEKMGEVTGEERQGRGQKTIYWTVADQSAVAA